MSKIKSKATAGLALGAALGLGIAPLAAAASPRPARTIFPKRGAAFVGVSSQKSGMLALPVDIRVSPNAQFMTRFDIQWAATCQNAAGRHSYGGLSVTLNKKITPPGVFADNGSFTRMFSNGDKGLFTIKLFGRFTSPLRAAGTFRVTVLITDSTGATTDMCDSNDPAGRMVSWSATN